MSERSSSASYSRIPLSVILLTLALTDSFAQQPSNALQLPGGARSGSQAQSEPYRDPWVLMAQGQEQSLEIPPVVERPLGLEEGPRIRVRRFELIGAVDHEAQSLRVSDLNALLGGHVNGQPPDGYTINQFQAIADEVTRFYRERGFILAQAIIPAQEVSDGIITMEVLEGSLGNVVVEGNQIYGARVIEGPFRRLQGRPITQDGIEQALLDVQGYPGLTVFGTFTQGDEVGDTDIVVRVRDEKRAYITPSVDNYGSRFTGEIRALLDIKINNLFGAADQINGYILQTFDPDNGTYGGLNFRFPFGRNAIGFGGSTNQFDVGGIEQITGIGIKGTADQADIFFDRTFANGRFFSANGRLVLAVKQADTEIPGATLNEDELTVVSGIFDFFRASRAGRGFSIGSIGVDFGVADWLGSMDESGNQMSSRVGGDGEFAGGNFEKFTFNFEHLMRISQNNSLLFRVNGQWTNDMLVALEQFAIGGPQSVRAYEVAEALADSGGAATLEWIINAPGFADSSIGGRTWGEVFQVSLFADYGYGELNNPIPQVEEETVEFSGYGLGLQFNVPGSFFARFDVATPITSRDSANGRDPQYFFRLSYTF